MIHTIETVVQNMYITKISSKNEYQPGKKHMHHYNKWG